MTKFPMRLGGFCLAGDTSQSAESNETADRADCTRVRKTGSSFEMFSPLQKLMLDDVLRQNDTSCLLRPLDPSRCPEAEQAYWPQWHRADEDIRFAHVNVSEKFRHHHSDPLPTLDDLIDKLVTNPRSSQDIAALVAVRLQDTLYVVMGNRRLKCYKQAYENGGVLCWFKVIVHEFPRCDSIRDRATRFAFRMKAIQAMSTMNLGKEVEVKKRRRW